MKKVILFLVVGIGALCTLSSCLQNEEPAGVENLRNAKSELIKAQAQMELADAAYRQAQVAWQEIMNAREELENRLKELEVQRDEAYTAYIQVHYELLTAQETAASETEIARLQAAAAEYLRNKQYWENQMALEQKQYEADLLDKEKLLAQAEYNYQAALDEIAALSAGLTQAELNQITNYKGLIDRTRANVSVAREKLIDAQKKLTDARYDFDAERLIAQAQRELELQQLKVDLQNALIEEVKAMDLEGDASVWESQIAEIETEIEALNTQIAQLSVEAQQLLAGKAAPEAEIKRLQDEQNRLKQEYEDLQKQIDNINAPYLEYKTFTLEIPARLQTVVYSDLYRFLTSVVVREGFEYNSDIKEYSLPDNKLVWESTAYEVVNLFETFDAQSYKLGTAALAQWNDWLTQATYQSETTAATFAKYNPLFTEGLNDFKELAAEYGYVVYNKDELKIDNNMADAAKEALANLQNASSASPAPTQAQVTAWIDAIRTEQDVRNQMVGNAVDGYEDFTYANYNAGTVTLDMLIAAVDFIDSNPVIGADGQPDYTAVGGDDATKWSAAEKWNTASKKLYGGVEYVAAALTTESYSQIQYAFDFDDPMTEPTVYYEDALYKDIETLLFTRSNAIASVWSKNYTDAQRVEYIKDVIANFNTDADTFIATVDEFKEVNGINAYEELDSEVVALQLQQAQVYNECLAKEDTIKVQNNILEDIDDQVALLIDDDPAFTPYSQKEMLKDQIGNLEKIITSLEDLGKEKVTIPAYTDEDGSPVSEIKYDLNSPKAKQAWAEYVEALNYQLSLYEDAVADTQETIERLQNDEHPEQYYIEKLEGQVEDCQATYDEWLAMFNAYSDMFQDMLAAIVNGDELPETPEDPGTDTPEDPGTDTPEDPGTDTPEEPAA